MLQFTTTENLEIFLQVEDLPVSEFRRREIAVILCRGVIL
jgi:hypothetical protein